MRKNVMARQANNLRMTAVAGLLWGLGMLAADAATLGYQQIHSKAGEPLQIDIPVTNVSAAEADGLKVVLAPRQAFSQAGVTYSPALADVKLSLEKVLDDRYVIHITSTQPVDDAFLDAIIVLEWRSGRQSFIYTLFANSGNGKTPAAPVISPSVEPSGATAPAPGQSLPAPDQSSPALARPLPPPAPFAAGKTPKTADASAASVTAGASSGGSYTVQKGDTLSAVASQYASDIAEVTPEQMMLALYQANRGAFIDGDPNRIKAGAALKLPDGAQAQAVTQPAARRFAEQTREQFQAYRARVAEGVVQQHVTDSAGRSAGGTIEQSAGQQAVPAAKRDELKLSRADAGGKHGQAGAREEDQIARDKALAESQARVAELEKNVADLQKLLALKNQALASLQQQPGGASGAAAQSALPAVAGAGATVANSGSAGRTTGEAPAAVGASASEASSAAASVPATKANQSMWDTIRQSPYTWPGVGFLAVLLGIGWLMRRGQKASSPAASIGQDGPYDTGNDADGTHGYSLARQDTADDRDANHSVQADEAESRVESHDPGSASAAVGLAASALTGAAAYAAHQPHIPETTLAGERAPVKTSVAPNSVAQVAGDVDLSLPGVPDDVGALPAGHMADQTEDRPWASVKFTMAPESTLTHHDGEADGATYSDKHEATAPDSEPAAAPASGFSDESASAPLLKPLSFDLSGFNLDLKDDGSHDAAGTADNGMPGTEARHDGAASSGYSAGAAESLSDIDTKLELAAAYVAIGDESGARELLEEVLREGDESVQAEARKRLEALG